MGLWHASLVAAFMNLAAPQDGGAAAKAEKAAEEPTPAAMPADVKALVDRVQAFYERLQDFTATFRQDYTYKIFRRTRTSTGKVTFKKPGMMRWEYETPEPKTFVLAGDRAYTHDPRAMLITRTGFDQSQLSASVTFLFGKGKLEKEFSIAKVDCANCTGVLLELTPLKKDPRFRMVRLEVEPKTAQVLRSIVIDPDGSENAIAFSDLKTNVGVKKEVFVIDAPKGTEVRDMSWPKPSP